MSLQVVVNFEVIDESDDWIVVNKPAPLIVHPANHTEAARELGWIFERRQAKKEYLAIVTGWPDEDTWECAEPIIRAGELGPSEIWVRQTISPLGRDCVTKFQVERRFQRGEGKFSLIRCFPETGRMHQIRVHLAACGFPIVGDKLYAGNGSEYLEWMANGWTTALRERLILPRHALHAACLEITWAGRAVRWEAEMGRDLVEFAEGREISETP